MSQDTKSTENATEMDQIMALSDLNIEQLQIKAKDLGVEVQDSAVENDYVEAIVEAMAERSDEVQTEVKHGNLISLRSRDQDGNPIEGASDLLKAARNKILANKEAGVQFDLFLQDRAGDSYNRRAPGVRCTNKNMHRIEELTSLLPDGSQDAVWEQFKANPEQFEAPVLAHINRRTSNGNNRSFVMLYLREKQENLVEVNF